MKWSMNIVGAGQLGKALGHLLVNHQLVTLSAVCNQSEKSSLEAIQFIGKGRYCASIAALPLADITLISTPDEAIPGTCEQLSKNRHIKPGHIVFHCSGALTSDVLIAAKTKGGLVASVHPMQSFADPKLSAERYEGTYCALEGDEAALSTLRYLFDALGSKTFVINKQKKSLYHAGGVFASNYLITLSMQALGCLNAAGVEHEVAIGLITHLMRGTISNLESTLSPQKSLTGPIQRGDIATIMSHLSSLPTLEQKKLYALLGQATLPLTRHPDNLMEKMAAVLSITTITSPTSE